MASDRILFHFIAEIFVIATLMSIGAVSDVDDRVRRSCLIAKLADDSGQLG